MRFGSTLWVRGSEVRDCEVSLVINGDRKRVCSSRFGLGQTEAVSKFSYFNEEMLVLNASRYGLHHGYRNRNLSLMVFLALAPRSHCRIIYCI